MALIWTAADGSDLDKGLPGEIVWYVAGETVFFSGFKDSNLLRYLKVFLAARILRHLFSDDEILAIYCHLLPFEHGRGLSNSARYRYNRGLSHLTIDEVIVLLAVARAPTAFTPDKEVTRARKIRELLMSRYNENANKFLPGKEMGN